MDDGRLDRWDRGDWTGVGRNGCVWHRYGSYRHWGRYYASCLVCDHRQGPYDKAGLLRVLELEDITRRRSYGL